MEEIVKILGVEVNKITLSEAEKKVKDFLEKDGHDRLRTIYTPNTEIVMRARKDKDFRELLNRGDVVIPDGIGLVHAARIKKNRLPERVTGFDLSIKMLELAEKFGYSIFLMGGAEGVAKAAKEELMKKYPNLKINGYNHGYFKGTHIGHKGHDEEKKVIEKINKSGADILFVGLGAPKQEIWINENRDKLNCKVAIGNGGVIDILAGKVKATPEIFQKLGLEWFYRLTKNPKRIKRQLALPLFVLIVLFSRDKIVE